MARLTLDPAFAIGPVDRRLFGSFVEHMGRCVYTGIFEPGHPGGRRARAAHRRARAGPRAGRHPGALPGRQLRLQLPVGGRRRPGRRPPAPARPGLAVAGDATRSGSTSSCAGPAQAGVEPMIAVNLGTRGVQEAADLLEYCNHPGGTAPSDLRRKHGVDEPHDVRLWCLGNEMDGPWQIGHMTARVRPARRRAGARHEAASTPASSLVACGSSNRRHADLRRLGGDRPGAHLRARRLHLRCTPTTTRRDGDRASFLASAVDMDAFIDEWSPPPTTSRPSCAQQAPAADLASTSGTSGTSRGSPSLDGRGWVEAPGADRGRLHRHRRRGGRRPADQLLRHADRVGVGVPGAAGQRHRADPHRDRRAGLAADHLPPVRAHRPATPAAPCCGPNPPSRPMHTAGTATCPRWTPSPRTTRRPARWPSSPSTAATATSRSTSTCGPSRTAAGRTPAPSTPPTTRINTAAAPDRVIPSHTTSPTVDGGRSSVRLRAAPGT